jgi:uncharacterized protein (TIRG00374 family)
MVSDSDQSTEQTAASQKASDKASRKKMLRSVLIAVVIGLLINVLIGLFLSYDKLFAAFKAVAPITIAAPFLLMFLVYTIDSLRFMMVFRKYNIRLSFKDSLYDNIIGYFFSNITPGSVGGLPFQAMHFSKLGLDSVISSNITFSRLIESTLVQLVIVLCFFDKGIGMMSSSGNGAYLLIVGLVATIVLTFVFMLGFLKPELLGTLALKLDKSWPGKFIAKLTHNTQWAEHFSSWTMDLGPGFKVLWKHNTGTMILDIFGFLVNQILLALGLYIPLVTLTGEAIAFPTFLLSNILCGLIALFIPTPGASGSVEATHILVLGALTGNPPATMSAILIWRFGMYYLHLVFGALVYFFVPSRKNVYKKGADGWISSRQDPQK